MAAPESALDRLALDLDPAQAQARRARRARQINTVEVPRLRALGCGLLAAAALLHDRYLTGTFQWGTWSLTAGILAAYATLAWIGLSRLHERLRSFDLAAVLLVTDVVVWATVIYLTGGTRSWLFFILLARVADQTPVSFRRALMFAHVAPLGYAGVLLWSAAVDRQVVSWPAEGAKLFFLYAMSLYLAWVARFAAGRQARGAALLRLAKRLVRDLHATSEALSTARLRAEAALDQQAGLARERAQLHEQSRRQQRELERVFDSTSDGLIVVDRDGLVESANARAAELIGFDRATARGSRLVELIGRTLVRIGTQDPWAPRLAHLLETPAGTRHGDLQVAHTDRVLQWTATPTRDEHGVTVGVTFTFQDVTRNRDLIRQLGYTSMELEEAGRRMEEAHRAKEEFLANVSHEIRTPLSSLVGLAQLARESAAADERLRYLQALEGAADHLSTILGDILDFSRIDAGRFGLDPAPFTLHEVVNAVIDTVRLAADGKGLDLRFDVGRDVPDQLIGDAVRLRQILLNLMSNAVKFTERGEVSLAVEVASRTAADVVLHFTVADTGIGIPPDKQRLVFEAFAQADGSTTRRYGGTGLGLSIASRLAELMGGEISLESEVGRGSTFHVRVRFEVPAWHQTLPEAAPAAVDPPAGSPAHPRQVLVADDNALQRELVARFLTGAGYRAVTVASGPEALAELERGTYDLVLLDLQMPVMDGFQTAAAIRRREHAGHQRIPIVAITASALAADRDRCLEVGIDEYVSKPVSRAQLLDIVAERTQDRGRTPDVLWQPGDGEAFLAGLGHDAHLARRLIALFLDQVPALLGHLRAALEAGDTGALQKASHALKGAMGSFPARTAHDVAERLEKASLAGSLEAARALFPALEREIDRMKAALPSLI